MWVICDRTLTNYKRTMTVHKEKTKRGEPVPKKDSAYDFRSRLGSYSRTNLSELEKSPPRRKLTPPKDQPRTTITANPTGAALVAEAKTHTLTTHNDRVDHSDREETANFNRRLLREFDSEIQALAVPQYIFNPGHLGQQDYVLMDGYLYSKIRSRIKAQFAFCGHPRIESTSTSLTEATKYTSSLSQLPLPDIEGLLERVDRFYIFTYNIN
ncbi:unnamed protein product [Cylicostephanus goldi]|uniref:Uncharacterized protein n=1 Tax=Cylicostephanus goldi TaxID=71465 RepID=A0A3P6RV53_CYLGO|nr:unnamed protein product [Cylicostephanus goldi]